MGPFVANRKKKEEEGAQGRKRKGKLMGCFDSTTKKHTQNQTTRKPNWNQTKFTNSTEEKTKSTRPRSTPSPQTNIESEPGK